VVKSNTGFWSRGVLSALFLVFFLLVQTVELQAQYSDDVWIFFKPKHIEHPFRKWKPEVVLDGRQTFVDGENFRIGGVRFGLEYRRVHRFGLGNYNLTKPINLDRLPDVGPDVESAKITFTYTSLFYERIWFFSRRWEYSTAVHGGIGNIRGTYTTERGKVEESFEPIEVMPVEISNTLLFNPTWWMSIGGGVGYRLVTRASDDIQETYSGGLYVVRFKIRFGKMFIWLFNPEVKNAY
jgi:hypothetical protein